MLVSNYICYYSFLGSRGWRRETGVESVNDLNRILLRKKKKDYGICNVGDFSLQLYWFDFFIFYSSSFSIVIVTS